jgi:autotransporter-associated beta strand protein
MSKHLTRWIITAGLACVSFTAQAATIVKANNVVALNSGTSWTGSVAPGATDLAKWDSTVTAENAVLLGANLSFQGIVIANPAGGVFLGGSNTLTIGCQGINMISATANLSFTNATLALLSNASPVWNVASGWTLTVNPTAVTRATGATLSIQGSGTIASTTFTNTPSGIIGPWARYGTTTATKYATVSGGNIVGYTGSSVAAAGVADTTGMTNYDVTAAGTLGAGASFNTLRYTGTAGALAGDFQANGLLNAGAGALTFSNSVTVGSNRELVLTSPDTTRTLTLLGTIGDNAGGASGITVSSGGGTVSLTASNAYSGVTVVSAGTLAINKSNALGTTNGNTVIFYSGRAYDGGCLTLKGGITLAEPITIVGGEIDSGGLTIYIAASGETNTLAGPITIATSNHARIGAGSGSVLNIIAPITSAANSLVLAPNGGVVLVNAPLNIPGSIFLHGGPGAVILNTVSNNFSSVKAQQGNTLKLGVTDAIMTNKSIIVGSELLVNTDDGGTSSGVLDMGGVNQTINSLTGYLNGKLPVTPYYTRVITNSVATPSTLTVGSANGNSVFYGLITDGAGTVALGKIGTGTLLLCGTNTFSGMTTLSAGTLAISNALALQRSTLVCTNSGSVRFSCGITAFTFGGLAGTRNVALSNEVGAAIALTVGGNNSDTVYSGALSAGGSLTKVGTGTLTLAGTNTYTGTTSLTNGTLALGCDNALNSGNRLVVSGGTFNAGTRSNTLQRLVVTGAGTLALGDGSCHLAFVDSSEAWTGTLEITGNMGPTSLRFGTNASGLTPAQLDSITVGGKKVWLELNAQGYLRRLMGTVIRLY